MQVLQMAVVYYEKDIFIYEISSDYKLSAEAVSNATFSFCLIANVIVIMNLIYKSLKGTNANLKICQYLCLHMKIIC